MANQNNGLLASISRLFGFGNQQEEEQPQPGVTWMLLPPYDITGMAVVSGLLVENQGQEEISNVYISLKYPDARFITHMDVVTDEAYDLQGGGPRDSYVTVQLSVMRPGKTVVVYVAGHTEQKPEVIVALQSSEQSTVSSQQ